MLRSPGRWLAAHLMKLMVAYIVGHFDMELPPQRLDNEVLCDIIIPPRKAVVRIRRRDPPSRTCSSDEFRSEREVKLAECAE